MIDSATAKALTITGQIGRWTFPVDSPAVARAALTFYRPVGLSKLTLWRAARLAARAGILGMRSRPAPVLRPALVSALSAVLQVDDLRIATWTPAEGGRAVACAIAPDGRVVGYAKLAVEEDAVERLAREQRALAVLPRKSRVDAPHVVLHTKLDGVTALVLTPVDGRVGWRPWRLGRPHLVALASLVRYGATRSLRDLLPATEIVAGEWRELIAAAQERLETWMDSDTPSTFVHGDFTPWNVLERQGGVAAVDWEDSVPEGPPYWDLWHFSVQTAVLLGRGSLDRLEAAARGQGPLAVAVARYSAKAGVRSDLARVVLLAYLAHAPAGLSRHGSPGRVDRVAGLRFRRELLTRVLAEWQ